MGFFDNQEVGAVTSNVLVYNRDNLLLRLQAIEYIVIKFTRKFLEFIESIYVTPGPLAMYRRKLFEEVGKFDEANLTEDIEITWRFLARGYKIRMSVPSKVYSVAPTKLKDWYKQRLRWNMGGVQTIFKYKRRFFDGTMLGNFVLPFFIFSWVIGVFGLSIILYRWIRIILLKYLSTTYSVKAHATILSFGDISLVPNVLLFMGLLIFILGILYTVLSLYSIKEKKKYKKPGIFPITIYTFFYLLAYPIILIVSAYKLMRGKTTW